MNEEHDDDNRQTASFDQWHDDQEEMDAFGKLKDQARKKQSKEQALANFGFKEDDDDAADEQEMTFGNGYASATERMAVPLNKPRVQMTDNSKIFIDKVNIDKRRMKEDHDSEEEQIEQPRKSSTKSKRKDFNKRQLEKQEREKQLKQEFLELKKQNDDILALIEQQKIQNKVNFENMNKG